MTQTPKIYPLFMWAGGKTRLLKFILPHFPSKISKYVEPFLGGGAVFSEVYNIFGKKVSYHLNDKNAELILIYKAIRDDIKTFTQFVSTLEEDYLSTADKKPFYYYLRDKYVFCYTNMSQCRQAALLYFLLKTGFNGIWQTSKNFNSRYATPAGLLNHTERFIDTNNIINWHLALQDIQLTSIDFSGIYPPTGSLVYLDPPYRGGFATYGLEFSDEDHLTLLSWIEKYQMKADIFLSERDIDDGFFDDFIKKNKKRVVNISATYTAGRRKKTLAGYKAKKATELLIY